MANDLIPELRFSEFTKNWCVDKFENLTKINQGLQIPIAERYTEQIEGSYFYITNEFLKKNSDKKYYILNPTESVLCNKDDVLMTRTGNTGQVVTNVVGAFHNNFFKIKFDNEKINKDFLVYFLRLYKTQNAILRLAGTSTIPDLNHSDFYKIEMPHPTPTEQTKIATFLTAIDKRINLLQKKKAELEQYKKGVMQKLFSQTLRFKKEDGSDFEDWEVKKLGEVGKFQTSSVDKLSKENEQKVYLVNYMNVYRHENITNSTRESLQIVTAKEKQIETSNLKRGDILFTPSSETPTDIGHSVVIFEDLDNTLFSYHLMRFRPNVKLDLLYSHYFCNIPSVLKQLSSYATGSTRFTISVGNFSKIKVGLPSFEEQQKIATFLSSIDKSIDNMTNQIDDSVVFKKGLLQKVFV